MRFLGVFNKIYITKGPINRSYYHRCLWLTFTPFIDVSYAFNPVLPLWLITDSDSGQFDGQYFTTDHDPSPGQGSFKKYMTPPISPQCQTFTYRGVQQTPYLRPVWDLAASLIIWRALID